MGCAIMQTLRDPHAPEAALVLARLRYRKESVIKMIEVCQGRYKGDATDWATLTDAYNSGTKEKRRPSSVADKVKSIIVMAKAVENKLNSTGEEALFTSKGEMTPAMVGIVKEHGCAGLVYTKVVHESVVSLYRAEDVRMVDEVRCLSCASQVWLHTCMLYLLSSFARTCLVLLAESPRGWFFGGCTSACA
jgi:hypothetical protein